MLNLKCELLPIPLALAFSPLPKRVSNWMSCTSNTNRCSNIPSNQKPQCQTGLETIKIVNTLPDLEPLSRLPQMREHCLSLCAAYNARLRIVYLETSAALPFAQNRARAASVPVSVIHKLMTRWEMPDLTEAHNVDWIVQ